MTALKSLKKSPLGNALLSNKRPRVLREPKNPCLSIGQLKPSGFQGRLPSLKRPLLRPNYSLCVVPTSRGSTTLHRHRRFGLAAYCGYTGVLRRMEDRNHARPAQTGHHTLSAHFEVNFAAETVISPHMVAGATNSVDDARTV